MARFENHEIGSVSVKIGVTAEPSDEFSDIAHALGFVRVVSCFDCAYRGTHDCPIKDGVECIDAMYAISPAMAAYFSVGSALKYLDRAGRKGEEDTDLRKAKECWHMAKRMMVRKAVEDGKD